MKLDDISHLFDLPNLQWKLKIKLPKLARHYQKLFVWGDRTYLNCHNEHYVIALLHLCQGLSVKTINLKKLKLDSIITPTERMHWSRIKGMHDEYVLKYLKSKWGVLEGTEAPICYGRADFIGTLNGQTIAGECGNTYINKLFTALDYEFEFWLVDWNNILHIFKRGKNWDRFGKEYLSKELSEVSRLHSEITMRL